MTRVTTVTRVIVQLARGSFVFASPFGEQEALGEALKEIGVKSVGHRLKIFAALQDGLR